MNSKLSVNKKYKSNTLALAFRLFLIFASLFAIIISEFYENHILFNSLILYTLIFLILLLLIIGSFHDFRQYIFPHSFTLLFAYVLVCVSFFFMEGNINLLLINLLISIWLLTDYYIDFQINKKFTNFPFKRLNSHTNKNLGYIIITISMIVIIAVLKNIQISDSAFLSLFSSYFFAFIPFGDKALIRRKLMQLSVKLKDSSFPVSAQQVAIISSIKTLVVTEKKIIASRKYRLVKMKHRSSIQKGSVLSLCRLITLNWDKKISKIFKKYPEKLNVQIVQNNSDGIELYDEKNNIYLFGNKYFVKDFLKTKDEYTHYLIKNKLIIGKFLIKEKINQSGLALVKQLNSYCNTALILNKNYLIEIDNKLFDRIYYRESMNQQIELIQKLENKAATALISDNILLSDHVSLNIILSKTSRESKPANLITFNKKDLNSILNLFKIGKEFIQSYKSGNRIKLIQNIVLLIIVYFFYQNPEIVLLCSLVFFLIEIIIPLKPSKAQ